MKIGLTTQALAFSPISIQTQRTQRKRLRLDGNRALVKEILRCWPLLSGQGWKKSWFFEKIEKIDLIDLIDDLIDEHI